MIGITVPSMVNQFRSSVERSSKLNHLRTHINRALSVKILVVIEKVPTSRVTAFQIPLKKVKHAEK